MAQYHKRRRSAGRLPTQLTRAWATLIFLPHPPVRFGRPLNIQVSPLIAHFIDRVLPLFIQPPALTTDASALSNVLRRSPGP